MDNKKRSHLNNTVVIQVFLISLISLGWLFVVYSYVQGYYYAFPKILSIRDFLSNTVLNICVPVFLISVGVFFMCKRNKMLFAVFFILATAVLAVGFFRSAAEILYAPTICSYTSDPADYGKYDASTESRIEKLTLFPTVIPVTAEDVQYLYYFEQASSDTVYIELSFSYQNDDEIEEILNNSHVVPCVINQFGEEVYDHRGNNVDDTNVHPSLYGSILVDRNNRSIAFVSASSFSLLPRSFSDLNSIPS